MLPTRFTAPRLSALAAIALIALCSIARAAAPYRIEAATVPGPPPIGGLTPIEVRVTDAESGSPVSGADVRVMAHMPAMPMGEVAERAPEDPRRPGTYTHPWSFSMAGDWAVRVEVKGPKGSMTASVPIVVGGLSLPPWHRWIGWGIVALVLIAAARLLSRSEGRRSGRAFLSGGNLIALATFLVVLAAVVLVVRHFKRGQVDWNAMSMDMADFRSPIAVEVAKAHSGTIAASVTYTGSVAPFIEQSVYPRAEGYLTDFTVYVGSRVRAGQLLARLEAPDLAAKAREAEAGQAAASHDVVIAQDERDRIAQEARAAAADVGTADGAVNEAVDALASARETVRQAGTDRDAARAAVRQAQQETLAAQAGADRWKAEIAREARLFNAGAVSREEYESEQAQAATAQAALAQSADKIAEMTSRQRTAEAHVAQTRADARVAQARIGQMRNAARSAREKVAAARFAVATAGHAILHSRAMVGQAAAAAQTARIYEGFRDVRATTAGVVTERLVSPGVLVNPQTAIVKIARLDKVRLQANVAERDLSTIHVGTPVVVHAPGLDRPVRARVTDVFPVANPEARTAIVEALVDNGSRRFSEGRYLSVDFLTTRRAGVLLVPAEAVVQARSESGAARNVVWTVVKDGEQTKAHENTVDLGVSNGRNQEIRSGLKEGDAVVTRGHDLLTEGSPVMLPGSAPAVTATAPAPASSSSSGGGMTRKAGTLTVALSTDPAPPKSGDVTLHLNVTDAMGRGVAGAKVHLDTTMPTMGMGGPSVDARDDGGGRYSAVVSMSMGAPWRVAAKIRAPGQPPAAATFDFLVQ